MLIAKKIEIESWETDRKSSRHVGKGFARIQTSDRDTYFKDKLMQFLMPFKTLE